MAHSTSTSLNFTVIYEMLVQSSTLFLIRFPDFSLTFHHNFHYIYNNYNPSKLLHAVDLSYSPLLPLYKFILD